MNQDMLETEVEGVWLRFNLDGVSVEFGIGDRERASAATLALGRLLGFTDERDTGSQAWARPSEAGEGSWTWTTYTWSLSEQRIDLYEWRRRASEAWLALEERRR